jgi:hypothetical protein
VYDVKHIDFDRAFRYAYVYILAVHGQTQAGSLIENAGPHSFNGELSRSWIVRQSVDVALEPPIRRVGRN